MRITVRLFAHLRERAGRESLSLDLCPGSTLVAAREEILRQFPEIQGDLGRYPVVVNGKIADPDTPLEENDEVAWLPPVAGGSHGRVVSVAISEETLDPQALGAAVQHPSTGAVLVFSGVVRDHEGDRDVEHLHYEAYETLAQQRLESLAEEALKRWPAARIALAHRTGKLSVGEASVIVAVASPHRAEAFDCCRTLMDEIKEGVPIWKKSYGPDGERWVEGKTYVDKRAPR